MKINDHSIKMISINNIEEMIIKENFYKKNESDLNRNINISFYNSFRNRPIFSKYTKVLFNENNTYGELSILFEALKINDNLRTKSYEKTVIKPTMDKNLYQLKKRSKSCYNKDKKSYILKQNKIREKNFPLKNIVLNNKKNTKILNSKNYNDIDENLDELLMNSTFSHYLNHEENKTLEYVEKSKNKNKDANISKKNDNLKKMFKSKGDLNFFDVLTNLDENQYYNYSKYKIANNNGFLQVKGNLNKSIIEKVNNSNNFFSNLTTSSCVDTKREYKIPSIDEISSKILVRLNVVIKVIQDQNDLVSLLQNKKENEFKFSDDSFVFFFEIYKVKMIDKIRNISTTKGSKKKYEISGANKKQTNLSIKKETISVNNDNDKKSNIATVSKKNRGTSTFLDYYIAKQISFTNLYGMNTINTCNLFFKAITESRCISKAIKNKIQNDLYKKFMIKVEKYTDVMNKYVNLENDNVMNKNKIYNFYKRSFDEMNQGSKNKLVKEDKKINENFTVKLWDSLNKNDFGIRLNNEINVKDLEKRVDFELIISKQLKNIFKEKNKNVIKEQLKKQRDYISNFTEMKTNPDFVFTKIKGFKQFEIRTKIASEKSIFASNTNFENTDSTNFVNTNQIRNVGINSSGYMTLDDSNDINYNTKAKINTKTFQDKIRNSESINEKHIENESKIQNEYKHQFINNISDLNNIDNLIRNQEVERKLQKKANNTFNKKSLFQAGLNKFLKTNKS